MQHLHSTLCNNESNVFVTWLLYFPLFQMGGCSTHPYCILALHPQNGLQTITNFSNVPNFAPYSTYPWLGASIKWPA